MDNSLINGCNLSDFSDRVVSLRRMLTEVYEKTGHRVHDEILRFSFSLKARYPGAKECMLYLLVIGGTLPVTCERFDFPGEDSVEQFIQQLYNRSHCTVLA